MIFENKNSPRWIVFLVDLIICSFSLFIAYLLRFNINIPISQIETFKFVFPLVLGVRGISFLIGRTYAGIVRYTSLKDAERILIVNTFASLSLVLLNLLVSFNFGANYLIPFSIIIIEFLCTVFFMTALRLMVKTLYAEFSGDGKLRENAVIYGTKELAVLTKRALELDIERQFRVIGFMDNFNKKVRKKLEGITIFSASDFDIVIKKFPFTTLIFAKTDIKTPTKNDIIEKCLNHNVKVLNVPDFQSWINGELSVKQIKNIKIDDLLQRQPIQLDKNQIKHQIVDKHVLVTGAAGSIGSELVRQLTFYKPKKIILFDQAESPLYDIELELREKYNFHNFDIIIGDITNIIRVNNVFEKFKIDIVYHAAAYKHVPMMESNPEEAIQNNFIGTKILSDLAIENQVDKFVMISTDKAVNPTNVMGASKRVAEIYIQSINYTCNTSFITTRFGNVLGSNGSVIPRFKRQIESGGPVTVTHPDVTRFFMTIPEACQLVLEASAMGNGGEIFIFDMGKSVKVADLAKNMIKLSGLKLGKDIQLVYTGLRPGEKLYEELLHDAENTLPTHHPQIMIAKVKKYDFNMIRERINKFIDPLIMQDKMQIVRLMKEFVPEFKSQNSIYEQLDSEKLN
jgi:FlaA1/EpsC-like NDP-sugar epimerase